MAFVEKINWHYQVYTPHIEIRLISPDGMEWPNDGTDDLAVVDTGFTGEILISTTLYDMLELNKWENIPNRHSTADGRCVETLISNGSILIPKLHLEPFNVEIITMEGRKNGPILIGAKFLRKFQLLLDGPSTKLRLCEEI